MIVYKQKKYRGLLCEVSFPVIEAIDGWLKVLVGLKGRKRVTRPPFPIDLN